jgi:RNA 2',3'-cyclic 3'-phosphodiesterase
MSPALIAETAVRPRQYVLWSKDFDPPIAALDPDFSGRPDAVFLAVLPPAEIADYVYRLSKRLHHQQGLNCPLVLPPCLHITQLGIDYYANLSQPALDGLCRALSRVVMPPFRFALNRATFFENEANWPFVLVGDDRTTPGMHILRAKLVTALREVGFKRSAPSFTPHMTLCRPKTMPEEYKIDGVGWTVRDFVLIHSLHGQHKHEVLGCWPLTARAP